MLNSRWRYIIFHCYYRTLASWIKPRFETNLNGHSAICYLIQIWIRLKKLKSSWKMTKSIHSQFFLRINHWIYITTFSEKFPNQWKKQTNSKVAFNILPLYNASSWIWWLAKSAQNKLVSQTYLLQIYYKFNVCFIRLENLVYQNNPFIIYTVIL